MTTVRLRLGARCYDLSRRILVMGTIEADGRGAAGRLLQRADALVAEGADLLSAHGPAEEDRLVELVELLAGRVDVPVAVVTGDARVLEAACGAGAVLGHDRSGFADPAYLAVAARSGASVVATHAGGPGPGEPVAEVTRALAERAGRARAAGLAPEQVVVDAGLEAKAPAPRAALLRAGDDLAGLGHPLLLSAAPDVFGGRDAALAAAAYGAAHGCRILRTADVAGTVRVVRIVERLLVAGGR